MTPITSDTEFAPPLRSQLEIVRNGSNVRWGAVIAAASVASALWLVLHMLGMGIGLIAVDESDGSNLRAAGLGIAAWSAVAPILALFAGGLVVSRLAPMANRINRMLHGALVWSIATAIAMTAVLMVTTGMMDAAAARAATDADTVGVVDAARGAEMSGRAMLGLSIALLLSLAAAVGGAVLIGHRDRRRTSVDDLSPARHTAPAL